MLSPISSTTLIASASVLPNISTAENIFLPNER